MAFDTNNNLAVSGYTAEALIATDFSATELNHFQVVKIAYGGTADGGTRVTSSNGLPVSIVNTPTVAVSSITNPVTVTGTVTVNQPVGVTATNLGIRALTAGTPSSGLAVGADFVRVVGVSGAFPVGVTASNFGIRALTAGDPTTAGAAGQDTVRIVGFSGGFAVGVTAVDLDIRSLTFGSDSVSVLNTVQVRSSADPFTANPSSDSATGLNNRVLRASPGANPSTSRGDITSQYLFYNGGNGNAEDTVRVVGLSGAWPISTFSHGLTNINNYDTKLPLHVDSTGALFVNLAAGSISVTADVSGLALTLSPNIFLTGVSFATPGNSSGVMPVHGYAGADAVPVKVSATNLDIRDLSSTTDSVTALITAPITITGDVRDKINKLEFSQAAGVFNLITADINTASINANVATLLQAAKSINQQIVLQNTEGNGFGGLRTASGIKVDIQAIAQPTGFTAGRLGLSATTTLGAFTLQSGVHIKSDLVNTGTVFVGFNNAVGSGVGFPLYAGDQIFIETNQMSNVSLASNPTGATVYFIGT